MTRGGPAENPRGMTDNIDLIAYTWQVGDQR
jgi:hypothetical protein